MKDILSVAAAYTAAIVGAGFASGQEVVSFFVRYGKMSVFCVFFAAVIFGLFAAVVLDECVALKLHDYGSFLAVSMGKKLRRTVELATLFFAVIVLCVMLAAGGELGFQLFGIRRTISALALALFCLAMMLVRPESSLKLNAVLGGIIVLGCIVCTLYLLRYREHQAFMNTTKMIVSGASYTGYNLLTAGAILVPMSARLKTRSDAYMTGFASGFAMLVMLLLMWGLLSIYYDHIDLGEMPMITMALRESRLLAGFYSVLMLLAVITTAASNGIGAVNIISEKKSRRTAAAVLITAVCFFVSGAGFSRLIDTLYRISGYAGILLVIYVFFCHFRVNIKKCKYMKNEE